MENSYIRNPLTGRRVLRSSVLGKKIVECWKSHTRQEQYRLTYQKADYHPRSTLSWIPWTYTFSSTESDVRGIFQNRRWFQEQVRYLQSLPLSSLRVLLEYTKDSSRCNTSEKKHQVREIIRRAPPLHSSLYVWRGIHEDYISKRPFQRYTNRNRFISTSLVRHISMDPFFIGSECCLLRILLPANCSVLFLPIGESTREMEILLFDKSVFTILDISYPQHRKSYLLRLEC